MKVFNICTIGIICSLLMIGCNNSELESEPIIDPEPSAIVVDSNQIILQKYENNSLETGSQPYLSSYGKNQTCSDYYCSELKVITPSNCDVVVIIKEDDQNGSVVAHSYIKGGESYTFKLEDGTYQPFFYMGNGWCPEKDLGTGVQGGFVKDETFSKDYPQTLESCRLTYELILQQDGNFQTKPSDPSEMF